NRSIKLDIISGQSFYRRARLSNRLPYNKMWISSRWEGRAEQGTGNRASGRRRGQMSEVGGPKFRGTKYEVRGASGTLALTPTVSGDPPNRNREQGTRNKASGRSQRSHVGGRRFRGTKYEVRGASGTLALTPAVSGDPSPAGRARGGVGRSRAGECAMLMKCSGRAVLRFCNPRWVTVDVEPQGSLRDWDVR